MTSAILRFAPVWTSKALDEPRLVRELMVDRQALHPVRLSEPIPVVVDHDMDRQVGTVRELAVRDEVMSGSPVYLAPWWFAHVEISDPPSWLKRGGAVSWCRNSLWEWEPTDVETTVLRQGLIREVSILSPSVEPAEPLARVMWVSDERSPAVVRASDRPAAGVVYYGDRGKTLRREFKTPITIRDGSGRVIRNELDGSQTIWTTEADYLADRQAVGAR